MTDADTSLEAEAVPPRPLRVRAEVLDKADVLACVQRTSNVLRLHTDLMGTVGTVDFPAGYLESRSGQGWVPHQFVHPLHLLHQKRHI